MGILAKPEVLKKVAALFAVGVLSFIPFVTFAQTEPHKYGSPQCPSIDSGKTGECSYADGTKISCRYDEAVFSSGAVSSVTYQYNCENPDNTKTVCTSSQSAVEAAKSCEVRQENWKPGDTPIWSYKNSTNVGGTTEETCTGEECTKTSTPNDLLEDPLKIAVRGIAYVILSISSFILGVVGSAFNWAMVHTVFEFGTYFGTSESMLVAWGVLRDVGNIILLFGFILMGVLTILNLHDYPVKKTIPGLIIFAVLLNFSLFASQVVIDVANAFASSFYQQASLTCTDGQTAQECLESEKSGISGLIVERAGVSSAFNISSENLKNLDAGKEILLYLGLAIFVTITWMVLLAATVMFIARAVILSFLMVISPLGFAAFAIPPLKKHGKKWWGTLISQAFFAPIFLLLILVSLKLMEVLSAGVVGPNAGLANALAGGNYAGMGIITTFAVMITFVVLSLSIARGMAGSSSQMALDYAGKMGGWATSGVAFAGRRTVGRFSSTLEHEITSEKGKLRGWAQRNPRLAYPLAKAAKQGSEASYEFRNTGMAKSIGKFTGMDLGKGPKGGSHGIHGIEEKAIKEREKYYGTLAKPTEEQLTRTRELEGELDKLKKRQDADEGLIGLDRQVKQQKELQEKAEAEGKAEEAQAHGAEIDRLNKQIGAIKKKQAEERTALEGRIKEEKAKAEKTAIDTVANALEKEVYAPGFVFSIGKHADHEAIANIRKKGGKSEFDRAIDTIRKVEEENKKKSEKADDGHDDHAHAPAPKARPAAAPKAGGDSHGHDDHH